MSKPHETTNNTQVSDFEEYDHFLDCIEALEYYQKLLKSRIEHRKYNFSLLKNKYSLLLPDYLSTLDLVEEKSVVNQNFLRAVTQNAHRVFCTQIKERNNIEQFKAKRMRYQNKNIPSRQNIQKVLVTMKQIVRDWGKGGERERSLCYQPILSKLEELYPQSIKERSEIKILNPGSGLGRLVWEIASLGFSCQGNEFSYFMLFVSHFILNCCSPREYEIYPFLHQFTNNLSASGQIQSFLVPDTNILSLPSSANFSMVSGDFLEIYSASDERGKWDAVVSCFFLDTARNVVQYISVISRLLKPGGYFINFGPLLYHYSDCLDDYSLDLSYNSLKQTLSAFGLKMVEEKMDMPSTYCDNVKSMKHTVYSSVFFVCKKMNMDKELSLEESDIEYTEEYRMGDLKKLPGYYYKKNK